MVVPCLPSSQLLSPSGKPSQQLSKATQLQQELVRLPHAPQAALHLEHSQSPRPSLEFPQAPLCSATLPQHLTIILCRVCWLVPQVKKRTGKPAAEGSSLTGIHAADSAFDFKEVEDPRQGLLHDYIFRVPKSAHTV